MSCQQRIGLVAFAMAFLAAVSSGRAQAPPPQTQKTQTQKGAVGFTSATSMDMTGDQVTNIPYFSLRDGMSSILTLNNNMPLESKVAVTIYNGKGKAQALSPMTLAPYSIKDIKLEDVVVSQEFDAGNIEVRFTGAPMGVTCQVGVISAKKRQSFESREQDMMDFKSSALNGILWLPAPEAEGFLAVTNAGMNNLKVQLMIGPRKRELSLFPRETRLINLREGTSATPPAATLVRLQHDGRPGDIITTGFVLNPKNGYSSGFAMLDPSSMGSNKLAGAHFRFGAPDVSEGFPEGTRFFAPLLLANVGTGPVSAQVLVDYTVKQDIEMTPADPKQAPATEDKLATVAVKSLTIAPGDVQRIELSEELAKLGVPGPVEEAGVEITYDGPPGTLMGELTSVDQSGDYAFEVPIKDPAGISETAGGNYPWTLENGADTILHLKNTSEKQTFALVKFQFPDGGSYTRGPIPMEPYRTVAIDIQNLKDSKKPDLAKKVFPANATQGKLIWMQRTPHTLIGRAEQVNVKAGVARSFSCGYYCPCPPNGVPTMTPDPAVDTVGSHVQFSATESYWDCAGVWYGTVPVSVYGWNLVWSSSDIDVASVDQNGYASFNSAGSASIKLDWDETFYWDDGEFCYSGIGYYNVSARATANCGDARDTIIGEYLTYGVNLTPTCSDFSQNTHSVYFQASELRVNEAPSYNSWALIRIPLTVGQSSGYGLDKWRANYGSARTANSVYRTPAHNAAVGGATQSQHMYGTAADLNNDSGTNEEYNLMVSAAQNAGYDFIEPPSGPCETACVHTDWRDHNVGQYAHD